MKRTVARLWAACGAPGPGPTAHARLADAAVAALRERKWRLEDGALVKRYGMASHTQAAQLALATAAVADRLDHHPRVSIDHRFVTYRLFTHAVGGLTELDARLADEIDALRCGFRRAAQTTEG